MNWSLKNMGNILRMIFGVPKAKGEGQTQNYQIKAKMVNPDVVVMDYKSFRKSKAVQAQVRAAKDSMSKFAKHS